MTTATAFSTFITGINGAMYSISGKGTRLELLNINSQLIQANSIRNWAGIMQSWSRELQSVARTAQTPYSAFIQLILPVLRFSLFPEQINATVISCGESVNKKWRSLYSKAFAALDLWGSFSATVGGISAMPVQGCRPFVLQVFLIMRR